MTVRAAQGATHVHRALAGARLDPLSSQLVQWLSSGGDARITLNPETGLNRYLSAPYPRDVLAYSSSTISDISPDAFAHLAERFEEMRAGSYADSLDALRLRIRAAFDQPSSDARIVFAPSGTDLEYVALACALGRAPSGVHNILLGANETGSGCVHSAHGRFFAQETALDHAVRPADPVAGCGQVSLVDVPVRCPQGLVRTSAVITSDMVREIESARRGGRHSLVHVVHGSKTGLVLPNLGDIDALQSRFGEDVSVVVDACQTRITSLAVSAYLDRGCVVLMTGSKFVGAPPFNGWALVPESLASTAARLPEGFRRIFRRAEWPEGWPGREGLEDSANLSLVLRLNAALFELERFQSIPMERAAAIIDRFERAMSDHLIVALGAKRVCPSAAADGAGPIEMRTLITIDLSALPGLETFEQAQALHRRLALEGVRLGQPVKCVRNGSEWGGTLRVGLSMPQMARWASMDDADIEQELARDATRMAESIRAQI